MLGCLDSYIMYNCTKNWIYTNLLDAKIWCKKVQTRGNSKAKVINTAFAFQRGL